jgi:CheY-like chemotaxis protein
MPETREKKKVVLLVDDDQFLLNMYSLKFRNTGFEIETAASALVALQKLRDGMQPDVLLCDLVMPAMDGIEFIKRVKEEKLSPAAAIVVLTNQGQSTEVEKAKELGVDGYIVKASSIPSEVVGEVKKILAKRKP